MLKRFFSIITISLVITGSFFSVYNIKYPVYADSTTDGWENVTTNQQLADAFRYYCKSRDLTIEGSAADALTSFTTKTFNGLCNTLGIDMTALQAQIKYKIGSNIGTQFLFTTTGVDAYNRLFSQFLQDNDLEVGDSVNNKTLKSGTWFQDDDGHGCWAYVLNNDNWDFLNASRISEVGSMYRLSTNDARSIINSNGNNSSFTIKVDDVTYNNIINVNDYGYTFVTGTTPKSGTAPLGDFYNTNYNGWLIICLNASRTQFALAGAYTDNGAFNGSNVYSARVAYVFDAVGNDNAQSVNIYITTNNNVINNNTYEGDTVINNNGDIINNNNPDPDEPNIPDPNPNPTPDPPTIPDSGGWQDFSLPEMPNDWLIYGMEKKFPFDIPFNIMFALSLLNHEPEIPKFEGDIDLKVCTWHYDIDLTPFDDIATILRRFEVLAFIIGLAILTKELINWG